MKRSLGVALAALLIVVGATSAAHAGSASDLAPPPPSAAAPAAPAFIISLGYVDAIYEAGPLPEEWLKKQGQAVKEKVDGFKAGYKCQVITVLWAVIHRKECTPVAFVGKAYLKGEPVADPKKDWVAELNQAIGAKYKLEDLKLSFWTQHGRWVLAGAFGFLVLLWIGKKLKRKRR